MNNNHGGEECYSLEYSNDASTVLPPPAKKQQHRRVKKDEEEDEEQLTLDRHIRQAAKDLETKGYAVIPAVLSKKECDEALAEMWQVWESATAEEALPLKPSGDYNRVSSDHLPPHTHGIIHTERLNHARVVRRVRCHPNVVRVFASLYGTQDLLSSMDRVNFKFPGRRYSSKEGSWAHVDQNPSKKGLWCVQAYVDILGTPNDKCPGNRLYEGSHLLFDTVLADSQEGKEADGDWVKLSKETKDVYLKDKGCKMAKPLCDPGSMILWDSRTVHDPDDGLDSTRSRFVVYTYATSFQRTCYRSTIEEGTGGPACNPPYPATATSIFSSSKILWQGNLPRQHGYTSSLPDGVC